MRTTVRRAVGDPPVLLRATETQFQGQVIDVARMRGWLVYHPPDNVPVTARSGTRYVQNVVPGFPDLCMVRERVVFAELKTTTGRVSKAQREWHDRLRAAGAELHVWRPADIVRVANVVLR